MAVDAEFSEFFASQYARLCWLGCALTGNPAQAEELAQEALVRTWWRWRLVGRPHDPASYVRKVLVHRHRSLLRRAAVEARSLARFGPEELAAPAGDERAMVLWQAVQGLPVRQRVVLVLRFYEDRTEAEVAQLLGLSVGTVKSRSHRPWDDCGTGWARPVWTPQAVGVRRDDEPGARATPALRTDRGCTLAG